MSWIATALSWGGKAAGFLGGIKVWLIAGGVIVLIVGGLWLRNGQLAAERDLARRDAADSKIILNTMIADNELARTIVAARDAKISELEGRTRDLIEKIRAVPITKACSSSPAVRTLLDGLRDGAGQTR
jgi:hypothetical protein